MQGAGRALDRDELPRGASAPLAEKMAGVECVSVQDYLAPPAEYRGGLRGPESPQQQLGMSEPGQADGVPELLGTGQWSVRAARAPAASADVDDVHPVPVDEGGGLQHGQGTVPPVAGFQLVVRGLADGPYDVEWWDTWKGVPVRADQIEARGGGLLLTVPELQTDTAAKIRAR